MGPPECPGLCVDRMKMTVDSHRVHNALSNQWRGIGTRSGRIQPNIKIAIMGQRGLIGIFPSCFPGLCVEANDDFVVVVTIHGDQCLPLDEDRRIPFTERSSPEFSG